MALIGKLTNNSAVVRGLAAFAFGGSRETRIQALDDVRQWAVEKELVEASVSLRDPPFKDEALELLDLPDLQAHLRRTQHLGLLSDLVPFRASRAMYVTKQAELLLMLKQANPGLGLGKRVDGLARSPTGLVLAQSWALLFSYGRYWGTHATERAVLFELGRDRQVRDAFLDGFGEHAPLARQLYHGCDIYTLSQLVSLRRLARGPVTALSKRAIEFIGAWAGDAVAVRRVKVAFRLARRLAYLKMQSLLGLQPVVSDALIEQSIRRSSEHHALGFVSPELEDSPFEALLQQLDEFHFRTFFTSPSASARVLSHLREFKQWWRGCSRDVAAFDELYEQPPDWPVREPMEGLVPLFRFELPLAGTAWRHEVEFWWQGGAVWGADVNFFITHTPRSRSLQCDVYAGRALSAQELNHILVQLARHRMKEALTEVEQVNIGRAVAKVLVYVLESWLVESQRVVVRPLAGPEGAQFATVGHSIDAVASRLNDLADEESTSTSRATELRCCAEFVGALDADSGALVAVQTGVLVIVDETGRELGEVDGLVLESAPDRLLVHLLEVKSGGLAGSKRQLDRLKKLLQQSELPLRDHRFEAGNARSVCFSAAHSQEHSGD